MDTIATAFEVRPLDGPFGAEVTGLDLAAPLDARTFAALKSAFERAGVLVVRDQVALDPADFVEFGRRFGELEIHVQKKFLLDGHPELLVVSNVVENGRPIGLADAGHYWHSDLSYKAAPSLGSFLHAQEVPVGDGDTLFVDMRKVHDALPAALRAPLRGRRTVHDYAQRNARQQAANGVRPALDAAQLALVPPVEHPAFTAHPADGAAVLFVNEGFTTRVVGLPDDESRAVLDAVFAFSVEPSFVLRHRWRPHDLVMWDNRSVIHRAAGCPPDRRRTMYRVTVKGTPPASA